MPISKNCNQCQVQFEIEEEDLLFYAKVLPLFNGPSLCPNCRHVRRLAWRNERNLYKRTCAFSGKNIISNFSPDPPTGRTGKSYKIYAHDIWWSDKWDAMDYGRDFDFSRPFFEQFDELLKDVPLLPLMVFDSENSDYTNYSWKNKNCYLLFDAGECEDISYSRMMYDSKMCMDCMACKDKCELCYQCLHCFRCYNCVESIQCHDCHDIAFCFDCRGCSDCFMCTNLRKKQYHIFNKAYSKEEYQKKMKEIHLGNFEDYSKLRSEFLEMMKGSIHCYATKKNVEACSGDFLENCKNCDFAFNSDNCLDSKYICDNSNGKDFHDDDCSSWGVELCYETLGNPGPYKSAFVISCGYPKEVFYAYISYNCLNCFGCVSLRKKQYCILNKQYTKEEYQELLPRIVEHMKKTGEWGEFFPISISPFAYNETLAQDFYPIEEEVGRQQYKWKSPDTKQYQSQSFDIPADIQEVDSTILNEILGCESCSKNYKIIDTELAFYKKMGLPIPRRCPDCRHMDRAQISNQRRLFERECDRCHKGLKSTYSQDRPEKVYCEQCYLDEVV